MLGNGSKAGIFETRIFPTEIADCHKAKPNIKGSWMLDQRNIIKVTLIFFCFIIPWIKVIKLSDSGTKQLVKFRVTNFTLIKIHFPWTRYRDKKISSI